jgi:2-dehydro-3-deoxygluconokinase
MTDSEQKPQLKLKERCRWALAIPTSMGVRISPPAGQPVHSCDTFTMQATSAESNVASVSSFLGLPVKVLTNFVKESPISRFIKDDLARRHMSVEGVELDQGGPWGLRHQFNIADSGFASRGPRVHNDRAGEVGRLLKTEDFDLERIFGEEGVAILHLSGLIAALSEDTGRFCLELARRAKKEGTLISFDLNHRASFWEGRDAELRKIFTEIASLSDILIGNEEDFQLCFNIQGPEAGGKKLTGKLESFKEMITGLEKTFPQTAIFATTLRQVVSANLHIWGAILKSGDTWYLEEPREIGVLDRIGGGDGFVGGLLYGILKGWPPEKWIRFGWATGALAASMLTDYGQPADEAQVWSIWEGNARVKR